MSNPRCSHLFVRAINRVLNHQGNLPDNPHRTLRYSQRHVLLDNPANNPANNQHHNHPDDLLDNPRRAQQWNPQRIRQHSLAYSRVSNLALNRPGNLLNNPYRSLRDNRRRVHQDFRVHNQADSRLDDHRRSHHLNLPISPLPARQHCPLPSHQCNPHFVLLVNQPDNHLDVRPADHHTFPRHNRPDNQSRHPQVNLLRNPSCILLVILLSFFFHCSENHLIHSSCLSNLVMIR